MDMDTDDKGTVGPQEVTGEEGVACDMEQSEGHLNAKVEDAPVFRPTKEEFKDPLAYISKIRPEAEAAGICRIVPPSGWKPPFTLNTSTLRFQTRKQNISRLGAAVRLSKDFDKRLRRFMFKRGTPLCGPVVVGGETVDPFNLYKAVTNKGGAHVVGDVAAWEALGREVGLPEGSGASFRDTYTTSLLPYEQAYFAGSKAADSDEVPPNARMTPVKKADPVPAASLVGRKFIRYIKEREVFMTATVGSATHRSSFHVKYATLPDQEGPVEPSEVISKDDLVVLLANGDDREAAKDVTLSDHCEKCYRTALAGEMACCYNCTALRHPKCMEPPQECLSGGDWFCPDCVIEADKPSKEEEEEELAKQNGKMGGRNGKMGPVPPPVERMLGAFGFEDGERYSLASFEKRAREWRNKYFESTLGTKEVEEAEVEAEFWRIVDNVRDAIDKRTPPTEDVMVEYGSDLDTGVYGSAFPLPPHLKTPNTTPSKQANGGANANPKRAREEREYANSPWNINNLPVATGSMLHHLDVPVTGVVVPWLYVGMCMSAFCWHAEDHYLYSINYHHRGGPKQWYGIPGAQADRFESWMRGLYPDLFERNPDLLLQLVTMVNPSLIVKEGIPVYKTMQRPGEFIITFPQAYHAGFNHDFNVAEAVNFAPADFLPWGGKAQELYRRLNRAPVFSQDQMVVAAARALLAKPTPKENSACLPYVLQEMGRMVEQATRRADHAKTLGIEHFEVSGEQEMAREQEQHMRQNRDRSTHPTAMGENADPNALPEWVYEELRPKTRSIASPDDSKRGPSSASKHSDAHLAPRHGLLKGPQCSVCKQYCFLEQVYCPTCGPELGVCGEHIEQCCACPVPTRVYKTRCPLETLHQLHQGLTTRQAELKAWQDEVDGIVATLELYKSPPKPEPNAARSAKAVASREVSEADHAITSVAPVAKALTRYLSPEMWSSKIDLHRGAQLLKTGAQLAVPPSTLRPLEEALRDARTQALAVAALLGDDGGAILDARGGVGGSRRRALAKKKGEALERGATGGEKDGRRSLNDVLTRAKCVLESPIKLETAAIAALKTVAEVTHLRREAWDLMGVRCSGEFDALDDLIAAAEAILPQLEAECIEFREATTAPKGQGARIKGKIVSGRWEGRRYSFSASLEFRRRVGVIEKAFQDRNIAVPELDLLEKGLLEESESRSRKVKLDEEEWVDPDQLESLVPDAARRKPQKRKRQMPAFPPLSSFKKGKNGRMVPAYPPPPSYHPNGYYPYPYYPQYPPPGDYPAQEGHGQEYPPQEYGQDYPPQEYGQQGYAHPGYAQQGYYEYPEEPEA